MSRKLCAAVLAASIGLLVVAVPLRAHHSEAAEFDATKPVRVTGVVKKVEWTNPHIWFYVEGKDEVSGHRGRVGVLRRCAQRAQATRHHQGLAQGRRHRERAGHPCQGRFAQRRESRRDVLRRPAGVHGV